MTLAEVLGNEQFRRHEFPVVRDHIFLAHGAVCPLPRRVAEAVKRYTDSCTLGDQEVVLPDKLLRHTRELAARLLNVEAGEIAFVGSTTYGLSLVAAGLTFHQGDNVLIYFDDYPSNVYPWAALADQGVNICHLNVNQLGQITLANIAAQVNENTRLVALASCHFISGWRIDVQAIGEFLRSRNIAFCVDSIQTAGAFPTPMNHADFMAADAHKWLLGPCGAGILYVRREWQDRLRPAAFGWGNVRCPNYIAQETLVLHKDARRYEAGTGNLLGFVGLHAALELLLEIDLDNIAAELLRKRAWLVPALQEKGYTVLHADAPPQHASGIIAFHRPDADMGVLHEKLTQAKIITSLRTDRVGNRYLRLSPHFYNTDAELQRVLALL